MDGLDMRLDDIQDTDMNMEDSFLSSFHEPINSPFQASGRSFDWGKPAEPADVAMAIDDLEISSPTAESHPRMQQQPTPMQLSSQQAQISRRQSMPNLHYGPRRAIAVKVPSTPVARATIAQPSQVVKATIVGYPNSMQQQHAPVQGSPFNAPMQTPRQATIQARGQPIVLDNSFFHQLWKDHGLTAVSIPVRPDTGMEVDLGRMVCVMNEHGGIRFVRNHKKWNDVAKRAGLPVYDKGFMNRFKRFYGKYVCTYEEQGLIPYVSRAPSGVTPRVVQAMPQTHKVAAPHYKINTNPSAAPVMAIAPPVVETATAIVKAEKPMSGSSVMEKRLKPWRTGLSREHRHQIDTRLAQRLFLLSRQAVDQYHRKFVVLESANQVHTVHITRAHTCTCHEHVNARGSQSGLCMHILFCLHKVIGLPRTSKFLYQDALLTTELEQVFAQAPVDPATLVMMESHATNRHKPVNDVFGYDTNSYAFGFSMKNTSNTFGLNKQKPAVQRRAIENASCPICCELLGGSESLTYCTSQCGSNFHQACMYQYQSYFGKDCVCPCCKHSWEQHTAPADMDTDIVPSACVNMQDPSLEDAFADPSYFGSSYSFGDSFGDSLTVLDPRAF